MSENFQNIEACLRDELMFRNDDAEAPLSVRTLAFKIPVLLRNWLMVFSGSPWGRLSPGTVVFFTWQSRWPPL